MEKLLSVFEEKVKVDIGDAQYKPVRTRAFEAKLGTELHEYKLQCKR